MPRRAATALAAAVALLAAAPAATRAATFEGSLVVRSVADVPDADGALAASAAAVVARSCAPEEPCAWLPLLTTVDAGQACRPVVTASSWIPARPYDDAAGRASQRFAPTWREWPASRSGPRRACLYAEADGLRTLVAQAPYVVPAPGGAEGGVVRPLVRTPIPRSVGRRNAYAYRLSTRGVPSGVPQARFLALARVAAARWGLRFAGRTSAVPRGGDGVDAVGFASDVPRGVLGVTRVRGVRYYRRGADGRLRFAFERIAERDLALSVRVRWHAGPGVPPIDRVDLQTVLIHELGHYAGNAHVRTCRNSPMWVGLRAGEWWWSRSDWFQFGCRNAPSRPAARAAGRGVAAGAPPSARAAAPAALRVERRMRRVVLP